MSYLQVDLKAVDLFPALTFRANLPDEDRAEGSLRRLWLQCWRQKSATVTGADICVAFRVRWADVQARGMLLEALVAYGFIANAGHDEWRVRGAEKRLGLLKARQKAAAAALAKRQGKAPEATQEPAGALLVDSGAAVSAQPPVSPPAQVAQAPRSPSVPMKRADEMARALFQMLSVNGGSHEKQQAANGQSEADRSRNAEPPAAVSQESAPADAQVAHPGPAAGSDGKKRQPRAASDEAAQASPHQALIERLCASYERLRGAKYGFTGRDAKAVEYLRRLGSPEDVIVRWEAALQTEGYKGCSAIYELPAKWNHHTNRSNAVTTSQQLTCTATDDEWQELVRVAAKQLEAPANWQQSQGWRTKVEALAYETWCANEQKKAG